MAEFPYMHITSDIGPFGIDVASGRARTAASKSMFY
jgi:hypothetical protein